MSGEVPVSRVRAQDAEARQRERALLRPRGRVPLTNKQTNTYRAQLCTCSSENTPRPAAVGYLYTRKPYGADHAHQTVRAA